MLINFLLTLLVLLQTIQSSIPRTEVVIPLDISQNFVFKMKTRLVNYISTTEQKWTAILTSVDPTTNAIADRRTIAFSNRNILQALFPVSYDFRPDSVVSADVNTLGDRIEGSTALVSVRDGRIIVNPSSVTDHVLEGRLGFVELRTEHSDFIALFAYIRWQNGSGSATVDSEEVVIDHTQRPRAMLLNLTSTYDLIPYRLLDDLRSRINTPVSEIIEERTRRLVFRCDLDLISQLPTLVYSLTARARPDPSNNFAVNIHLYPEDYLEFDPSTNTCETRIRSCINNRAIGQLGIPFASVTTIVYERNRVGFGEPETL